MAINENITLRFRGENQTGTTFKDVNESAKKLGKELAAGGEIGKQAMGKIASAAKDGVTPAIVSSMDAVQALAKGGVWGGCLRARRDGLAESDRTFREDEGKREGCRAGCL